MEIKQAVFHSTSLKTEAAREQGLQEVAFIGRSNVGKSSLINTLCKKSGLAYTSSTPGKTQCINRFLIDNSWIITDLPGYGYAKVSKTKRAALQAMINSYIRQAPGMVLLFVLLDSRHPLQQIDLDFLLQLGQWQVPFAVVLTKADKLSKQHWKNKSRVLNSHFPSIGIRCRRCFTLLQKQEQEEKSCWII